VHGYVLLKLADGSEVVRKGGFQHNRKLRSGGSWDPSAVEDVIAEVKKAAEATVGLEALSLEANGKTAAEPKAAEPKAMAATPETKPVSASA